jgi:hypothetical protein
VSSGTTARAAPHRLLEGDENAVRHQQRILVEAVRRMTQKGAALDLQLLQRRYRIPLDEHRRAAPGGVISRLFFALEQQHIANAARRQEVRERGTGDAAPDDDDFEFSVHGGSKGSSKYAIAGLVPFLGSYRRLCRWPRSARPVRTAAASPLTLAA